MTVISSNHPGNSYVNFSGSVAACSGGRIWSAYKSSVDDGAPFLKNMFKLVNVSSFFASYFNPNAPSSVIELGNTTKQAKNMISAAELPIKIEKFAKSVSNFNIEAPVTSGVTLTNDLCGVVSAVVDSAELSNAYATPVPAEAMKQLKIAGSAATVFSSVKGYVDIIKKMVVSNERSSEISRLYENDEISRQQYEAHQEKSSAQFVSNILSLVNRVSCIALGVLGLAALFTPVPAIAAVSLATFVTVVGLAGYFYDKIARSIR
jgi:hypothetical protein